MTKTITTAVAEKHRELSETVHAAVPSSPGRSSALCGAPFGPLSVRPELVTCSVCKEHIKPAGTTKSCGVPAVAS